MKKTLKIGLIIELQIILALVIFAIIKLSTLNNRVFDTNTFLYQVLRDQNLEAIQEIEEDDIVIGDKDAPCSIIIYSKFNCYYCRQFFETTYLEIEKEYIKPGYANIVLRFLTSPESEQFQLVQLAYEAYHSNIWEEFNQFVNSLNIDELNSESLTDLKNSLELPTPQNYDLLSKKYSQAKKAGISGTPTFIIGEKKIVGARKLEQFRQMIDNQLDSCH